MREVAIADLPKLPVGPVGRRGLGSWGIGTLIATEAALFAYLLFAYYYLGATAQPQWVLDPHPALGLSIPNTCILLISSATAWYAERGVLQRRRGVALTGFGATIALGIVFVVIQYFEWMAKPFRIGASSYASMYFVTTGFHIAHVVIGILVLIALFVWTALDYFSPRRRLTVTAGVFYWHFVDIVWLLVFTTYYITPYLGFGQ